MDLLFHGFSLSPSTLAEEGENLSLQSLQPKYEPIDHAAYVDMLESSLAERSSRAARNIALTGNYGSGKSSIISELESRLGNRSVNLALATMQEDLPPANSNDGESGQGKPSLVTNFIQKEIVKQLLYREKPSRMRGSRYRRIESFRWWPATGISAGLALAVAFMLIVTGMGDRISQRIPSDIFWVQALILSTLTIILAGTFLTILWTAHGKLRVDKFTAGAASFSLTGSDSYYFDIFLDEIIFFFQRTGCDVAVFEDIDRFEDPHIFETLRELNTILNSSKQLGQRPIRFVYAIKDSVFEMLGRPREDGKQAREWSETAANRTKFFDLVVPIVPFITHRTSRDLITEQMEHSPEGPSANVISTVAPYLTDMRLIKNIRNEYEIFRRVVLSASDGLVGLNADSLFAMVIYKNVHLTDYEMIKSNESRLDDLYRASRLLVKENIDRLDQEIRDLSVRRTRLESATAQGQTYATRLFQRLSTTSDLFGAKWDQQVRVNGSSYSLSAASSDNFWSEFLAHGGDVRALDGWGNQRRTALSVELVEKLLGMKLEPEDWKTSELSGLEEQIASCEKEKAFLKSADISALVARPDLVVGKKERTSLLDYARSKNLSELAIKLLETKHIDENYALYVSKFHGINVSMPAMNFILKVVQPGTTDAYFQLTRAQDVQGVIDEAGDSLFNQEAIYNIDIIDYLIKTGDTRLDRTYKRLARVSVPDLEFIGTYIREGGSPESLISNLAPQWTGVFTFLGNFQGTPPERMVRLLDSALLGSASTLTYEFDENIRKLLFDEYPELSTFTGCIDEVEANKVANLLQRFGIFIPELEFVTSSVRQHLIDGHLYQLTLPNLSSALEGESDLALDVIKDSSRSVYEYVLRELPTYLSVLGEETPTIRDASRFPAVLIDVADSEPKPLSLLISRAHRDCVLEDLATVPTAVWPHIAEAGRMLPSFKNVNTYLGVEDEQALDSNLAHFLENEPIILDTPEEADETSARMAVRFINSKLLETSTAISLVKSLRLNSPIALSEIKPRDSDIFGELLALGLLNDTSELFVHIADQNWATKEKIIVSSTKFHSYLEDVKLSRTEIHNIATSVEVPNLVKEALILALPAYQDVPDRKSLQALAHQSLVSNFPVTLASLTVMITGNISHDASLQLLVPHLRSIDRDDLMKIVGLLGTPYDMLTRKGGHQPLLPDTPEVKALLRVLKEMKLVSSVSFDKKAKKVRVYMKRAETS
ncbi:YobI family P-loop NTPase [Glutamicibacter sp.]|uniref:YobI family P-loop NTPase n=1 Tax=Glutamicibacter sp. TaxID=1931995 RepID=UPI002B46A060|nr:hypothetical protein [Glutamicibacter sp.]HJX77891.1 hypothetical protein [Glutamicibacter sp.]